MLQKSYTTRPRLCLLAALSALLFSACATQKTDNVLDRTAVPELRNDVPADASEIRELKFNKLGSESGHQTLHLRGQLFSKTTESGAAQIKPCGGCTILLNTASDTSIHVRITTESDGYFAYNGTNLTYSLSLENPGHNPLYLGAISFEKEGITTLRLINAAGSKPERFAIVKTGTEYTWSKLQ
jgi:hypothetical protein